MDFITCQTLVSTTDLGTTAFLLGYVEKGDDGEAVHNWLPYGSTTYHLLYSSVNLWVVGLCGHNCCSRLWYAI